MSNVSRPRVKARHKLLLVYCVLALFVMLGFVRFEQLANDICEKQNDVAMVIQAIVEGALVNPDQSFITDPELLAYLEGAQEQRAQFAQETDGVLRQLRCP